MNTQGSQIQNADESFPVVEIVQQPAHTIRFRYEDEKQKAGVKGRAPNTFPTLKVSNLEKKTKFVFIVSCVTNEDAPRPHPHKLLPRQDNNQISESDRAAGTYSYGVDIDNNDEIIFDKLVIECTKKTDYLKSLQSRKEKKIDPFQNITKILMTGSDGSNKSLGSIDTNCVKLCFQIFYYKGDRCNFLCTICTEAIHNSKNYQPLSILEFLPKSCCHSGGDSMLIVTSVLAKDKKHQVKFFDDCGWEEFVAPVKFSHGGAVMIEIPVYRGSKTQKGVNNVNVLMTITDGTFNSEPKTFTYFANGELPPPPVNINNSRKRPPPGGVKSEIKINKNDAADVPTTLYSLDSGNMSYQKVQPSGDDEVDGANSIANQVEAIDSKMKSLSTNDAEWGRMGKMLTGMNFNPDTDDPSGPSTGSMLSDLVDLENERDAAHTG